MIGLGSDKKYMPFSLMIVLNLSNRPKYPDKRGLCAGSEGMRGLRKVILRYDSGVQPLVNVKYIHHLPFAMFELQTFRLLGVYQLSHGQILLVWTSDQVMPPFC